MQRISVVLLGEKDHGKSTLLGRLSHETKSIPRDRFLEVKRASEKLGRFEWAHLLDSFRYERENEMTLDTTRAIIKIKNREYEFIDVPGHKELIKNMLTGAADAEFGILVIAADEGITPQTLEHLAIAKFLKLKKIIVVINKIDNIKNSQKIIDSAKKLGYPVVPMSASSGKNVDKLCKEIGKTFRIAPPGKIRKKFIAVVQDVYGKNIITRELEGNIQKRYLKFNSKIRRGDIISNQKIKFIKKISASCVYIEKLASKNLKIEANFKEIPIKKIKAQKNISAVKKTELLLAKKAFIYDKFIIKKSEKIIGLCRI